MDGNHLKGEGARTPGSAAERDAVGGGGLGAPERPLAPALGRGWHRRCPACGSGPMLAGYLAVRDFCPDCGEALHHQRADDGPAWLTIVVAGKLMAPLMLLVYELWRPEPLVMAAGFSAVFTTLALYLLPRFKGLFIAFQWAKRMHGFGEEPATR